MKISIHKDSWDKIINYAKAAYHTEKSEIGGMAVVIQDKDGNWTIEDPQIVKQEIASTTCDLDKEELAMYYTKAAMEYKDENFRFCWWHSHHTMEAFWSGTDLSSIDEYGEGESDVSFALVVNLKQEYKCRISVWNPVVVHQDIELKVIDETPEVKIPLDILTEVKAKCTTRSIVSNYKTGQLSITNQLPKSYNWADYKMLEDDFEKVIPTQQQIANFEAKYEYACNKVTEFMRQYGTNNWNAHKVKSAITHTNETIHPYGIQIHKLSKAEIEEFIANDEYPHAIVEVIDNKFYDIAEAIIDTMSYNQTFGGYNI